MALITCHECGKKLSSSAKTCPHCGVANPKHWGPGRIAAVALAVVVAALVVFAMLGSLLGSGIPEAEREARRQGRAAIDDCRERQDDELQDLATRRAARDLCDSLEAQFRARHGVDP